MIHFIEKIRSGDHPTKIKWLIIFSSVSMVFVVLVWVAALNVITANIENPEPVPVRDPSIPSLSEKFSRGFQELRTRTTNAFSVIKSSIGSRRVELQLQPEPVSNPTP